MQNKSPSLLDPAFVYVPSVETDLRKTFERIRRMQNNDAAGKDGAPGVTLDRKPVLPEPHMVSAASPFLATQPVYRAADDRWFCPKSDKPCGEIKRGVCWCSRNHECDHPSPFARKEWK